MKAMILAAGLGTRLRPLTDNRPKALVEICGRTLLDIALARLHSFGIRDVVINVHHFSEQVVDYLRRHDDFGMHIEISRENVLLDTGGGLKQAAHFFLDDQGGEEPFILHNVDVLSNIDLARMVQYHNENQALATLAVQNRETARYLYFDDRLELCGRRPGRDQAPVWVRPVPSPQPLAFSGIHVISPRLLRMMTEEGTFPIVGCYLRLAARGERILAFRADEYYWRDLGTPANVHDAEDDLGRGLLDLPATDCDSRR